MTAGPTSAKPLAGLGIVITRTREQARVLGDAVGALGGEPIEVPVIEVVDPVDGGQALRRAVGHLAEYDWVVITSPNGAERLLAVVDGTFPEGPRVAAVGPSTSAALSDGGATVDLVPERYVGESLLVALPDAPAAGGRMLLARAEVARDVLPDGLRAKGWQVDVVDAYRTVAAAVTDEQRAAVKGADVVTFTSSSTVERFVAAVGLDAVPRAVASIGPITSATARRLGLDVAVEASDHTVDGLVRALAAWAQAGRST